MPGTSSSHGAGDFLTPAGGASPDPRRAAPADQGDAFLRARGRGRRSGAGAARSTQAAGSPEAAAFGSGGGTEGSPGRAAAAAPVAAGRRGRGQRCLAQQPERLRRAGLAAARARCSRGTSSESSTRVALCQLLKSDGLVHAYMSTKIVASAPHANRRPP